MECLTQRARQEYIVSAQSVVEIIRLALERYHQPIKDYAAGLRKVAEEMPDLPDSYYRELRRISFIDEHWNNIVTKWLQSDNGIAIIWTILEELAKQGVIDHA